MNGFLTGCLIQVLQDNIPNISDIPKFLNNQMTAEGRRYQTTCFFFSMLPSELLLRQVPGPPGDRVPGGVQPCGQYMERPAAHPLNYTSNKYMYLQ